jgi:holo-[acyl-carrier protein] synthase
MKIYLGTDICEINRIQEACEKYGEKFFNKVFTSSEIDYCVKSKKHMPQRFAVRFAAKEAAAKALGVGINKIGWNKGVNWKDIEVLRDSNGAVSIILFGKAKELESKEKITNWAVSLSHSKDTATATVIGYK